LADNLDREKNCVRSARFHICIYLLASLPPLPSPATRAETSNTFTLLFSTPVCLGQIDLYSKISTLPKVVSVLRLRPVPRPRSLEKEHRFRNFSKFHDKHFHIVGLVESNSCLAGLSHFKLHNFSRGVPRSRMPHQVSPPRALPTMISKTSDGPAPTQTEVSALLDTVFNAPSSDASVSGIIRSMRPDAELCWVPRTDAIWDSRRDQEGCRR